MPKPVSPGPRRRPASALPLGLALAGIALLLPGCDNPACVFGGDCSNRGQDGVDPLGPPATVPLDGEWIAPGAPTVSAVFPSGTGASSSTPIVIRFSESIAPQTLDGNFELVQELTDVPPGAPTTAPPVPLTGALVGDGRMAVLFPVVLVAEATYRVTLKSGASVTDLTGQVLTGPSSGVLGTFTVAAENPAAPRVVATWPPAGVTDASTITEIAVVFDRPINPLTVNALSFQIYSGGLPPAFDPPRQMLSVAGPFGGDVTEPRVWTWRSVDPAGTPQPLFAEDSVEVLLSPEFGAAIEAPNGAELAPFDLLFDTSAVELPLGAELVSGSPEVPEDAIGRAQLDGTAPLMVLVRLAQPALAGDRLRILLFGRDHGTVPRLRALSREIELTAGEDEVLLEEAELDLVETLAPLRARFIDGEIAFAFQHLRGPGIRPVRMLDTDPSTPGAQSPELDTRAPLVQGLGLEGTTLDLRSDLRDLVVSGRADEAIRAVRVEALLSGGDEDNGILPPAIAADSVGRFVARPIQLGLIDPSEGAIPVLVTVYDRALNPSAPFAGTYTQVGAVGPGPLVPGDNVEVRVVSSSTLAPISGARVFTHEDDAGVVTPIDLALTDAAGIATVASASLGETILTVEAAGHDLFSFHGLAAARLDVLLRPTLPATGLVALAVTSPLEDLPLLSVLASDSRRAPELGPTVQAQNCFFNPFTQITECAFQPFPVGARTAGALSIFALNLSAGNSPTFAQLFLRGFVLELPLGPIPPGETQPLFLEVPALLDAVGADPERAAIDVAAHGLVAGASVPGLNHLALSGTPRISVHALAHGIPAPLQVGSGRAFQVDPESWIVRSAFAGVADGVQNGPDDALGELVERGTIEDDLFLQAELVDLAGNRAGARARFSTTNLVLDPPGVPTILGATFEGGSGSLAFSVSAADRLFDADGQPGLHRVRLTDGAGRGWDLWRVDAPDAAGGTLSALFPDVAALGGQGLAGSGAFAAAASSVAWPDLDPQAFLWSDVGRLRELFSASAPLPFTAP